MKHVAVIAAAIMAAGAPSSASSQTPYVGGSGAVSYGGIMFQPTFTFWPETITATPLSGSFDGPGTYKLNAISVSYGIVSGDTSGFFDVTNGSVDGQPFSFQVAYSRTVVDGGISDGGKLTIGGNTVDILGQAVHLDTLVFDAPTSFSTVPDATGTLSGVIASPAGGSAVPEAGTWVMMIGGLGAVGAMLRRRTGCAAGDRGRVEAA